MGQRHQRSYGLLSGMLAAWLPVALLAGAARAQERSGPDAAAERESAKAPADPDGDSVLPGELGPKIFLLPDKDEKLQAVLGFTFEKFIELYKLKNQLDRQVEQPSYTIEKLTLSGNAAGGRADLAAVATVTVHTAGWVRVPLRFEGAVLHERATFEGAGEHFLHFEADGDGYVCWIRGEADKTHQINLKLLAGVTSIGPENHLRLNVPRSAVSQLRLQVSMARALAQTSEGSTLESIKPLPDGKTEITAIGLDGDFDLAWHATESQVARLPTNLEASATLSVRINGSSVNTEARLIVRSYGGGEFDRFQVRLPPGAEYIGAAQPGATLTVVDPAAAQGKLYEVKLDKKTAGPVEVRIVTQRPHDPQQADSLVELAGFEVISAVRQYGTVSVQVEANWQVVWGQSNHVRQVDELTGAARRDGITAAFEYFVQPFSLTARIVPQKTRVRVESEYLLLLGGEETQLKGKLKYTIRGAKVRAVEIDLPGWDVDFIGPANLVDLDAALTDETGPLVIPLLQFTSGEIELTLEAHQRNVVSGGELSLDLPRPHGQVIAPANVAVLPDDNVELTVRLEQTTGLAPQSVRPQTKAMPERQQDALYFRTEGEASRLVTAIKTREQVISAQISSRLELDDRETKVDQRIGLQVDYQATDHVTLLVPRAIRPDRLSISLDGQQLQPGPIRERAESESPQVPLRVSLPSPRIGRCELLVSYIVRHEKLPTQTSTPLSVPLVMVGEGQISANEVTVAAKPGISVAYPQGPWTEDARHRKNSGDPDLALVARRAIHDVSLSVSSKQRQSESSTTIEKAWIQTRLSDAARQDRAVYRFTTSEPSLQVLLPDGADLGTLRVALDSRSIKPEFKSQRALIVPLSGTARSEHLLELHYNFAERQSAGGDALVAPQIESAQWVQHLYWQLLLPASEHLLLVSAPFTREFSWVWETFFWQRRPSLDQRQLEAWLSAPAEGDARRLSGESLEQFAEREQARARATNQYLFSTVGALEPLAIRTASRARLVLFASLPILIGGLILIYLPAARQPGLLLACAVLIAAGSLIDPDTALLLAQASILGLVLAAIAAVMARFSVRPALPTVPVRSSSRVIERSITERYQRAANIAAQPASTNPLVPTTAPEGDL